MTIPIRIISLDAGGADVRRITDALRAQGLEASVFPAVDGRHQRPSLVEPEYLDVDAALRYRRTLLTNSEIGCYLSHLRVIREAFEQGLERLCVLEEDIDLEQSFAAVFRNLEQNPNPDYEFIRLMALKFRTRKVVQALPEGRVLTRPFKGLLGAQGYIINRRGMAKLLQQGYRIWRPVDKLLDHFWDTGLACYSIEPHVIFELPTPSTIVKSTTAQPARSSIQRLQKPVLKFWRSCRLRAHRWRRIAEFYPHSQTLGAYGRTERIH